MEKTTSLAITANLTPLSPQVQADIKGGLVPSSEEKRRPLTSIVSKILFDNTTITDIALTLA